ncbi:MAG TPA: hypothetical protein PKM63_14415 [Panacibacter sp.]|nr:hypothetical protein [Panacibacter sp.]HNP45481.1 hypothetical protein [Panacibacter sp.]
MKKTLIGFSRLATLFAFFMLVFSFASTAQDNKSITGEVLDMNCYIGHGAHGDDHMSCATACIKGGAPMGLLTSDGKVYLLVADHSKKDVYEEVKKYAGGQVTITGAVSEKDGIKGIVVTEVKAKS